MRGFFKVFLVLLFMALIVIQFVKVERKNPRVAGELKAPAEVKNIFKTSCYDCHSNETNWPWYGYVAPVSWLVTNHVKEGREHLNFSVWETYNSQDKQQLKKRIWDEVSNDDMPLKIYTYTHPNSVLTLQQKNIIKEWSTSVSIWD